MDKVVELGATTKPGRTENRLISCNDPKPRKAKAFSLGLIFFE